MTEKYLNNREKKGLPDTYDLRETGMIRRKLREEYEIGEKDWFDLVKRGKFKHEYLY